MRYYIESFFTIVLWTVWLTASFYVGLDLYEGEFLSYAKPLFWLVVGACGLIVSAALCLMVMLKTNKTILFSDRNEAHELVLLQKHFGISQNLLHYAKTTKNITIDFPDNDQRCQFRGNQTSIQTA